MATDPWELARWDAVETSQRLAKKEITSRELTEAAIARSADMSWLNAVVTPTHESALASANAVHEGELAGQPFFTKDLVQIPGVRTAWGSAAASEHVSKRADPTVQVFNRCGLISLGKSATPELGLTATTEPLAFAPTHNPWARGYSSGGSSGGAASLVAAAVVPFAHGSDGGGSIRIPAACCGRVGLKVTRGRFDMEGSNLLPVNIAVHGVLTQTVRDTVAFWRAIEAVKPSKAWPAIGASGQAPAKPLRVAMFTDSPVATVDPEIRAAVEKTATLLRSLGHEVREVRSPIPPAVLEQFVTLWMYVAWMQANFGWIETGLRLDHKRLEPLTLDFAKQFRKRVLGSYRDMLRLRGWTRGYDEMMRALDVDVLLSPTLATVAPVHGHLSPSVPFDESMSRLYAFCPFTGYVNTAGATAISLPLYQSAAGLPIGIHFAAQRGREPMLLELSAQLEAAKPWPRFAPRA